MLESMAGKLRSSSQVTVKARPGPQLVPARLSYPKIYRFDCDDFFSSGVVLYYAKQISLHIYTLFTFSDCWPICQASPPAALWCIVYPQRGTAV